MPEYFTCVGCGTAATRSQRRQTPALYCTIACRNKTLRRVRPIADRFWEKVEKGDGCWIWRGALMSNGYGSFNLGTRRALPHRVAWELTNGVIPSGLFACHHCDNPRCVRPDHLFLGTAKDNHDDCVSKGRNISPRGEVGTAHHNAKLSPSIVRTIRARKAAGESYPRIAASLSVSMATAWAVVNNRTWRHVK